MIAGPADIDPAAALFHWNQGNEFRGLGRWQEALASYGRAIEHNSRFAEAHCNLGNVYQILERWEEALLCYDHALAVDRHSRMVWSNRGVVLQEIHRFDEALTSFERALELANHDASAHFNRGILLLLTGDLARGWPDYEWRWEDRAGSVFKEKRNFPQPRWQRSMPLEGKTILLYGEQGYGDTLQFCRFVPLVAALGASVILEVRAPLIPLLADLDGVSRLVRLGGMLPVFDCQCALMSLPVAFGTTLESIPHTAKYLCADAGKVAEWRVRLGVSSKPRIGLAWSGNPAHQNDAHRSIALSQLLAALPEAFDYVVLQKEVREPDRCLVESNAHVFNANGELHDFSDTAALCECLDLVISVDTSVAHLNAALGRPTWILLPFHPDWRWLLERSDSPWYSSVTLYRQAARGDWPSVLTRLGADLQRFFDCAGRLVQV